MAYPTPRKYRVKNPKKYKGDTGDVWARSSWETKFMSYCDHAEAILEWSSETIVIPYKHPLDGKIHRYFPDFLIKVKTVDDIVETWVVEIKPSSQRKEPRPQKRMTKKYINEVKTYAINKYKWDHAVEWCKDRDYKFIIFSEKELGIK
jgi:hypothetical protein